MGKFLQLFVLLNILFSNKFVFALIYIHSCFHGKVRLMLQILLVLLLLLIIIIIIICYQLLLLANLSFY